MSKKIFDVVTEITCTPKDGFIREMPKFRILRLEVERQRKITFKDNN